MPKPIDNMTYTELLNVVERRPLWAVDKILKLNERAQKLDHIKTELESLRAELCHSNDDFMSDHG